MSKFSFDHLSVQQVKASEQITDSTLIKKLYKGWRWRMFLGMYVGYVVFYFTRKNISPALPLLSNKLDIDIIELGILGSVFYIVYGVGKFISGLLADRANIRIFLAIGLFFASIIHLFFGYLNSLYLIVFFWGLNGAFQSMAAPSIAKGLVYWWSPKERATKWTLWSSSHTAGTFLIGILVAGLISLHQQGYIDWQAVFYVPGAIGLVCSMFLLYTLRDRPVSLGLPPIEEYKNDTLPMKLGENETSQFQIVKKYVLTNPYLWLLALANAFIYIIRFGTLDWGTKFMYDVKGIDEVSVAIFWSLMPLAGMPGGIIAGIIADKFYNGRCAPITIIYLTILALSIIGFYLFSGPDNYILTGIFLLLIGFLVDGPQNLVSGVQASRVTVKEAIASASGFCGLFGYIGATFSGIGLALTIQYFGWGGMYGICVLSCLIAGILVAMTWKKEKGNIKEKGSEVL